MRKKMKWCIDDRYLNGWHFADGIKGALDRAILDILVGRLRVIFYERGILSEVVCNFDENGIAKINFSISDAEENRMASYGFSLESFLMEVVDDSRKFQSGSVESLKIILEKSLLKLGEEWEK